MMEEKLFDLLEQKQFSALTAEERTFVLTYLSESEYVSQRKIFISAPELQSKPMQVKPLILPSSSRRFWLKSIPMYQVGMSVAVACLIFVFLLFSDKKDAGEKLIQAKVESLDSNHLIPAKIVNVIQHDTIHFWNTQLVETIKYVYDTIYIFNQKKSNELNTRTLVAQENRYIQDLSPRIFEAQNTSLKQDCTSRFIPEKIALRN